MKGVPQTRCVPIGRWRSLCFYIAAVGCTFKFVLHILAHIHTAHVHACGNVHIGVQGLNTCTGIQESTHCQAGWPSVSNSDHAVQSRVR